MANNFESMIEAINKIKEEQKTKEFNISLEEAIKNGLIKIGDKIKINSTNHTSCWNENEFLEIFDIKQNNLQQYEVKNIIGTCSCEDIKEKTFKAIIKEETKETNNPSQEIKEETKKEEEETLNEKWNKQIKSLREEFKTERKKQKLSQKSLSIKTGLSQSTISRIEKYGYGKSYTIISIAVALNKKLTLQ